MRIVVLGGLGFVGSRLVEALARDSRSLNVVVADAGWFSRHGIEADDYPRAQVKNVDLRTLGQDFFSPGDLVVNLAAVSNDAMGKRFDEVTRQINHMQAVRLAQLARDAGATSYIFASSASVYGITGNGPASESAECRPQTTYALSKRNAELDLAAIAGDDFPIYCLRFATACGWSENVRTDLAINDFAAAAIETGQVLLKSNGEARRPFISVQDMASAILFAMFNTRPAKPLQILNVGHNSWNMRILDVASRVGGYFGVPVVIDSVATADSRDYELDFSAWQEMHGDWVPQASLEEILAELDTGYRRILNAGESLHAPGRVRLDRLSDLVAAGLMTRELEWQTASYQERSAGGKFEGRGRE